ncbi:M1 family metallopeptidase [Echinicola jeungdonensis]|uniref:Aminopeptidase N n=1 Tax=Echinicola jeungdonensis TaxID=709343 RepID=A0ABV5J2D3_9BACT|nr:M1 family metallopeptidase [Echinicola jeungdonensis]MDN3668789.1 M1 family metallopeptidase [Echinicola jeungdonensis]
MKLITKPCLLMLLLFVSFQLEAQEVQNWTWGGPKDPLQNQYKVKHYLLNLELLPNTKAIDGYVEVSFEKTGALDTLRLNLIERYTVLKVEMAGKNISFDHHGDTLDIFPVEDSGNKVKVFYRGKTPIATNPPWVGGFTWERDQKGNHWMGLSSQNEGAKIFMPCLDHPSSEPSEGVDLHFKVPYPYFVAANGNLISNDTKTGFNYFHWATDYPINNYNINFTMGRLHLEEKTYTSRGGREIPMKVYVLEENAAKAPMLLQILETSVRTQEKYFGEFPFPEDKIGLVETPYLGMEHQTINAYGNNYQFTRIGEVYYDWLLYHELGHEWWGNKVTVADWADFWIHEGICSYGDWLFYREHGGESAYHKHARDVARSIKNENPVAFPAQTTTDEAYHSEIYSKGAFILHSLRYILGDDVFFPMLKAFVEDKAYTYENLVGTKDFTDFVQRYSGKDLQGFFDLYLYTTEVPHVKIKKKGKRKYEIQLDNIDFSLPMEVETSKGVERLILGPEPVEVKSKRPVKVDPKGWYLVK